MDEHNRDSLHREGDCMIESYATGVMDIKYLTPLEDQLTYNQDIEEAIISALAEFPTLTRTLRDDDFNIVGIVGIALHRPGVASAWSIMDKRMPMHGLSVTRCVKKLIDEIQAQHSLKRLDLLCAYADDNRYERWAQTLGFAYEGTLRKYGANGEDYVLMARIW